jgi:hypothetical protein
MDGFKGATTDRAQIQDWWGMWGEANIGIVTGEASGLMVVDIDPRNGGLETVKGLPAPLAQTAQVLTQGGGFHLYYQYQGKTKGRMGDGIDIKTDGGYVVAPPSVGEHGVYIWQVAMEPQPL